MATHKYNFEKQDNDIAMIKTITLAEFKAYVEELLFKENRAGRLDMHWNSQPHQKKDLEGDAPVEEAKESAAATSTTEESKEPAAEEAKEAEPAEPEIVPTYETEKIHQSINQFKKSMGLFVDNYKLNYATKNFSL